jgi:hypothetical protein
MAKDTKPFEDLSANAEQAVQQTERAVRQTVEQASGALGHYFDFMQKAVSSFPSGGTEFGEKLKSYTEQNISSAQEFVDKLSRSRDFQDALRIQTEYMQTQLNAFGKQTMSLSEAFTKTITKEVKIPFKSI